MDSRRSELSCMVFSGLGGLIMMLALGLMTVLAFTGLYCYNRFHRRKEPRPPIVFFCDLSKMLLSGVFASAVNFAMTAKVSRASAHVRVRGKQLEGIGWYLAICVVDVFVATPLSLVLGRLVNWSCRRLRAVAPEDSAVHDALHQNEVYGKYSDEHDAGKPYQGERLRVQFSWWYAQMITWSCCCVWSSLLCDLAVLASFRLSPTAWNPVTWIAISVTFWNLNCLLKQWLVVALGRIVLTYVHLALVDFFNKYKIKKPRRQETKM